MITAGKRREIIKEWSKQVLVVYEGGSCGFLSTLESQILTASSCTMYEITCTVCDSEARGRLLVIFPLPSCI